ncbi:MAG: Segregation and condensation protein B [Parcubacteria group bacterium GW2011_GWA2_47_12]|nr:MAG: Segregation and condensation protein B [Parcubacteria group bacterium GW2011_GWA2_47_12]
MNIDTLLEAVLFFLAEPVSVKRLGALLGVAQKAAEDGLAVLEEKLKGRGVSLVRVGSEVELRTAPAASALVEKLTQEELSRDIGKAGAEALAVILYRGQATRREIDWIRGVNSTFTLRELAARGLTRRIANPKDGRGYAYEPTPELLAHLGVSRVEDMPNYEDAKKELDAFAVKTENKQNE